MFENILIPLDGTPLAEQALGPALSLAREAKGRVRLATVLRPSRTEVSDLVPGMSDATEEGGYLERTAAKVRSAGVAEVSTAQLTGSDIAEALETHRQDVGADVIVMCTHGRGAVQRAWLGSVADRLVRTSDAPVLLVRASIEEDGPAPDVAADTPFRRVLVALDGSHFSRQALTQASRLAGDAGMTFVLARVIEDSVAREGDGLQKARALAEAKLKLEVQSFAAPEHTVESVVEFAPSVAQGILDLARKHAADVIVIATHGLSGVKRLVLGSVADKVVRGADRPVLVVRPEAA